jgi:hypothetical protein
LRRSRIRSSGGTAVGRKSKSWGSEEKVYCAGTQTCALNEVAPYDKVLTELLGHVAHALIADDGPLLEAEEQGGQAFDVALEAASLGREVERGGHVGIKAIASDAQVSAETHASETTHCDGIEGDRGKGRRLSEKWLGVNGE